MSDSFVSPDELRTRFAGSLQTLYRSEVPAYARLHDLVLELNKALLRERGDARADVSEFVEALSAPRHGAIRVGGAEELAWLARLFALFAMEPVDFYDLTSAGLPVMSTAFRPVSAESLALNPFRMFCSLLRPELIEDEAVRDRAVTAISERCIFSPALRELVETAEDRGGVAVDDAERFLAGAIEVFRWHGKARVEQPAYDVLVAEHKLVADIAAFAGPHINHLTPRVLDIDRLQAAMVERGFNAKAIVEGPPRREAPILLRQLSC